MLRRAFDTCSIFLQLKLQKYAVKLNRLVVRVIFLLRFVTLHFSSQNVSLVSSSLCQSPDASLSPVSAK